MMDLGVRGKIHHNGRLWINGARTIEELVEYLLDASGDIDEYSVVYVYGGKVILQIGSVFMKEHFNGE